ncbi:hypothetical protein GGF46_004575 [Coemansia sp. RSA 552]|nr:hypothetical protein GGF46_004575 [Coemansia sp. RSA 552]
MAEELTVTVDAHEYVQTKAGWRISAGLLLRPAPESREQSAALDMQGVEVAAGSGIVPAYPGPVDVGVSGRVLSAVSLVPEVAVQAKEQRRALDVRRTMDSDGRRAFYATLGRDQCRELLGGQDGVLSVVISFGHVTHSLAVHMSADQQSHQAAAAKPVLEEAEALAPETHVFHSMLRHREARRGGPDSRHPLFGQWVAEDSPQFRQAVAAMERQAADSRTQYKELARQATGLRVAYQEFMGHLVAALALVEGLPAVQPLVETFLAPLKADINQMLGTVCTNWDLVVVTYGRRLYESSFRHLEERKAEFESASNTYYNELARHVKRDSARRDEHFAHTRVTFDAARWAYFLDLWTCTGGWSELEMFVAVLKWAKSIVRAREASRLPTLHDLRWFLDNVGATYEEVRLQKSEITEFQAFIENPYGGLVREHALTPTEESNESDYVRVSLENMREPVVLQRPPMRQSVSTGNVHNAVGGGRFSFGEDRPRPQRLGAALRLSAVQPAEPVAAEPGLADEPVGSRSIDLARQIASASLGHPVNIPSGSAINSEQGQRDGEREGLLYARSTATKQMTGKNMRAGSNVWKQYWCMVRDGEFRRFTDWQGRCVRKGDPLQLNLATVRVLTPDAKQAGKRRFCFEVISPSYYGVFQAASAAEMSAWVDVLRRAIELSLLHNPHGPTASESRDKALRLSRMSGFESVTTVSSSVMSANGSSLSLANRASSERARDSELEPQLPAFDGVRRLSVTGLLPMLQQDSANELCADCSTAQPEWCSLNLCCLLCIDCSGVHRSLGTHVSKVRSLTLDVTSFTPVTIAMLLSTGNALNRRIFEPPSPNAPVSISAVGDRLHPESPAVARKQFIEAKYVRREFVDRKWRPDARLRESCAHLSGNDDTAEADASWLLLAAIELRDISTVLRALALGADPNEPRSINSRDIVPLQMALFGANEPSVDAPRACLEIAELLVLNGASLNHCNADGESLLHCACALGVASLVKYLVDKGANPLLAATDGQLPMDVVPQGRHAARSIVETATTKARQLNAEGSSPRLARSGSVGSIREPPTNSVLKRFTQSLAPASFATRMSVSTERPSLMELGSNESRRSEGGGWLLSLASRNRARRPTDMEPKGVMGLGRRPANGSRPAPIMAAREDMTRIDETQGLPTILSAHDEEQIDESPVRMSSVMDDTLVSKRSEPVSHMSPIGSAYSLPSSPITTRLLRSSSAAPSPTEAKAPVSRHNSMRSSRSTKRHTDILSYYKTAGMSSSHLARQDSPTSASSSFVDIRSADVHLSPPPVATSTMREYDPNANNRTSLLLHFYNNDDLVQDPMRPGLMSKLRGDKRSSKVLLRADTSNPVLRPSSSVDGLNVRDLDMRPTTSGSRLKFRLLPRSSRIALGGFFGRDKRPVYP